MFGLPRDITRLQQVEIELEDGARLRDLIVALRREIPTLEGRIILTDEERLTAYYAFNINGRFYSDDVEIQLQEGDYIALISLATGG